MYGEWEGGEKRGRIEMNESGGVRRGIEEVNEEYMTQRVGGNKYL